MSLKLYKSSRREGTIVLGEKTDDKLFAVALHGNKRGYSDGWRSSVFNIHGEELKIIIDNHTFFLIREDMLYVKRYNRDYDCLIDLKNKTLIPTRIKSGIPKIYREGQKGKEFIFKNEGIY